MRTSFCRHLLLVIVVFGVVIFVYTIQTNRVFIFNVNTDSLYLPVGPIKRSEQYQNKFKMKLSSSPSTQAMTTTSKFMTTTAGDVNELNNDELSKQPNLTVATLNQVMTYQPEARISSIGNATSREIADAVQTTAAKPNFQIGSFIDKAYLESLQEKYKQHSFILLVTYLRSGSTWLGDITKQAEDSFYVYEPFKDLIKQGYYGNDTICYNNNTCREPKEDFEQHQFALTTLRQIFNCDFLNMQQKIILNVLRAQRNECVQHFSFKGIHTKLQLGECVRYMWQKCLQAKFRIIKVIRLSMELVEALVNDINNLKVIHLVRDPRGITNSRVRGRFGMTKDDVPHAINLCTRMYNDVIIGDKLRQQYPDNFALVMYEALAERPMEGGRYIFNFINATYSESVRQWVYDSSHGNSDGFYSTTRNSTAALSHWRGELNFNRVLIIQNNCKNLFNLLGYIPFKSVFEMKNLKLKSRIVAFRSGFL